MESIQQLIRYCLLFWYDNERNWSIVSSNSINKPRREPDEYKEGDLVLAKFKGKGSRTMQLSSEFKVFGSNSSYHGSEISLNRTANEENLHKISVVAFTIVSLFIISTNTFVVVFLCRIKDNKLRDRVSMILSLSFCDITLGIGGLLLSITRIFNFCHRLYASVTFIFIEVGVISSVCQTLLICVERFLAVTKTTIQKKMFGRRGRYIITFTLLIFFFIVSACAKMLITDEMQICTLAGIYGKHLTSFVRVYFFGLYIPALAVIIILYIYTVYSIKVHCRKIGAVIAPQRAGVSANKSKKNNSQQLSKTTRSFSNGIEMGNRSSYIGISENTTASEPKSGPSNVREKNNRSNKRVSTVKAIRLLGIIILTMVLTTGAGSILFSVEALCTHCNIPMNLRVLVTAFWFVNSVMNPIIYTFGIEEFRLSIAKTFRCRTS